MDAWQMAGYGFSAYAIGLPLIGAILAYARYKRESAPHRAHIRRELQKYLRFRIDRSMRKPFRGSFS